MTRRWIVIFLTLFIPLTANAARLGKLTLFSVLGQPLVAEIEVTATESEWPMLTAKIVFLDGTGGSGVSNEKTLAPLGLQVVVEKRAGGAPFLRVTSAQPVKEPFIDLFVEIQGHSEKRVHEYSFLLEASDTPVSQPVTTPPVVATPPVGVTTLPPSEPEPPANVVESPPPAEHTPVQTELTATTKLTPVLASRLVKKGDTLEKIARETMAEGVTLVQMLVAYLRGNPDAFVNGNMNRLLAGKTLNVPDKTAAEAVDRSEASKIFVVQASEFDAYRRKLSELVTASPSDAASSQSSSGKVLPRPRDPPAATPLKDQLDISRRRDKGTATSPEADKVAQTENKIASERALREANERIQMLEKTVADLKTLASLQAASPPVQQQQSPQSAPPSASPSQPTSSAAQPPSSLSSLLSGNIGMAAGIIMMLLLLGFLMYRSTTKLGSDADWRGD
ncbi:MAG: FimV/HubP family polar landmark protein [Rhodocyclaceae bacterium]|nr:FimV/HubP family polar landmark protein [Rhodocyclaceae bacterium]